MNSGSAPEPQRPSSTEAESGAHLSDRPIVRVIWGGSCGSTYQRYFRPESCLPPPADPVAPSRGDTPGKDADGDASGGYSMFSIPLKCPDCHGQLLLRQPDAEWPDRLIGTCSDCRSPSLLSVEESGRITLTKPPQL
jgi:hypothetical protein